MHISHLNMGVIPIKVSRTVNPGFVCACTHGGLVRYVYLCDNSLHKNILASNRNKLRQTHFGSQVESVTEATQDFMSGSQLTERGG
jgi:hypothetical protein